MFRYYYHHYYYYYYCRYELPMNCNPCDWFLELLSYNTEQQQLQLLQKGGEEEGKESMENQDKARFDTMVKAYPTKPLESESR